jgi:hypothetical protein
MFEITNEGNSKEVESKNICEFMTESDYYVTKYLDFSKEKLVFKACEKEIGDTYYINEYTSEQLSKFSPKLQKERTIQKIDDFLSKSIYYNEVNATINKNDSNLLDLVIKLFEEDKEKNKSTSKRKNDQNDYIILKLNKVTRSKEEVENVLIERLNVLIREKKDYLKGCQVRKKIDEKTEEKYITLVNSLEKKIDLLDKRCKIFMNVNLLSCSNILTSLDEWQLIIEQLQKIDLKYNNILFKLVYRATRDGDTSKIFHEKCDKIGPNITLVKTGNGRRFGGFTQNNWEHLKEDQIEKDPDIGSSKEDINAFCFSIDLNKIYNICEFNKGAIFCCNNYGPTFSRNIFAINDNMLSKGGYCLKKMRSYFEGQDEDYEISGGKRVFKVDELEVLEIVFI